jgi:hypothetical protein
MTSSPPGDRPARPKEPQQTADSSSQQNGSNNVELSPQDLKRYLSQPVRSIFHEQAKSIVAIKVRARGCVSDSKIVPLNVSYKIVASN